MQQDDIDDVGRIFLLPSVSSESESDLMFKHAEPPPASIPTGSPTGAPRRSVGGTSKKLLASCPSAVPPGAAKPLSRFSDPLPTSDPPAVEDDPQHRFPNSLAAGDRPADGVVDENAASNAKTSSVAASSTAGALRKKTTSASAAPPRTSGAAAPSLKAVPQQQAAVQNSASPSSAASFSTTAAPPQIQAKTLRGVVEIAHPAEVDVLLVRKILADALQVPPTDVQVGNSSAVMSEGAQQQHYRAVISLGYCVQADAQTQRRIPNSEALAQLLSKNIPLRAALSRVIIQHDESHFGFLMRWGQKKSSAHRSASENSEVNRASGEIDEVDGGGSSAAGSSFDFNALVVSGMLRVVNDALFSIASDGSLTKCRDDNVSQEKKTRQATNLLLCYLKKIASEHRVKADGALVSEDDVDSSDDAASQEQRNAYKNLLREYGQLRGQLDELHAENKRLVAQQLQAAQVERQLRDEAKFLEDVTSRAEEQLHELRQERRQRDVQYEHEKTALEKRVGELEMELEMTKADRSRWRAQVADLEDMLLRTHATSPRGQAEASETAGTPVASQDAGKLVSILELRERQVQQLRQHLDASERERLALARQGHRSATPSDTPQPCGESTGTTTVSMKEFQALQQRCEEAEASLRERSMQLMQFMRANPSLAH